MKKYLKHVQHGLIVYVAAIIPQLLSHGAISKDVLISLVPGLVAAVASAFIPAADSAKVEQAVKEVLPK